MVGWSHGYDVSVGYTYGFYQEMGPDWLDFSTRISGFSAPRRGTVGQFRYLDLGTGQGVGLCLLAAANPQAEFLGIDFHPGHVAHANDLAERAELTNARFVEADFAELAMEWPREFGTFDYVVLHGIYTWVPPEVRKALIKCLFHATHPGSIVYNSYNSQPGWLGAMPFQHIARKLKSAGSKPGAAVIADTIQIFENLYKTDSALFNAMPSLRQRLDGMKTRDIAYLIQEYLHDSWDPFWHSEVARDFAGAKLDYIGTATIAETLLPGALPKPQRDIIGAQPPGSLRQDLQDAIINQTFRRDIFCRGARRSIGDEVRSSTRLHLVAKPVPDMVIQVKTAFGTVSLEYSAVTEIIDSLSSGPLLIREIVGLPGIREKGSATINRILAWMIHARIIAVTAAQRGFDENATHRLNAVIARSAVQDAPYRHIAVSKLGSAVSVTEFDLIIIDSWFEAGQKADIDGLVSAVHRRLVATGREIQHEGETLKGGEAEQRIAEKVQLFLETNLVRWRSLGALP